MYGNPLNPFDTYWWVGGPGPAIPTRQRSCLKQLCVFAFYDSKPSSIYVRLVWSISLLEDFLIPQYLK